MALTDKLAGTGLRGKQFPSLLVCLSSTGLKEELYVSLASEPLFDMKEA